MTSPDRARAHLEKAREFLEAARFSLDLGLPNAAMSNAVISGINSKDAVCLRLTGMTGKSENHATSVRELAAAGEVGADMSTTLARLLKGKVKSQYQAASVASPDAVKAVAWAERLAEQAQRVVTT